MNSVNFVALNHNGMHDNINLSVVDNMLYTSVNNVSLQTKYNINDIYVNVYYASDINSNENRNNNNSDIVLYVILVLFLNIVGVLLSLFLYFNKKNSSNQKVGNPNIKIDINDNNNNTLLSFFTVNNSNEFYNRIQDFKLYIENLKSETTTNISID